VTEPRTSLVRPTRTRAAAAPSYSVGSRLLVSGADDEAWGCGEALCYDAVSGADRRS
jgi:hypothetical protein